MVLVALSALIWPVYAVPVAEPVGGASRRSESPQPKLGLIDGSQIKPSASVVVSSRNPEDRSYSVSIPAGKEDYPGVGFTPSSGKWNLSGYGHVEAKIVNTGRGPLSLSLRVDNAGNWQDNPWDTETIVLQPGEAGTVTTMFGLSYGLKRGFSLDPKAVVNVLLFTTKSDQPRSFRIKSIEAGGPPGEKPPVAPDDVRLKPKLGRLFDGAVTQGVVVVGTSGAVLEPGYKPLQGQRIRFNADPGQDLARVQPRTGRFDLSDFTRIRVKVRNTGTTVIAPRFRIETNGGDSAWKPFGVPVSPGQTAEQSLDFGHPIDLGTPAQEGLITSDAVKAVALSVGPNATEQDLEILAVEAELPTADVPKWVGKRPPVPGEWIQTLDEEFSGHRLNPKVWRSEGENYYDKVSHWSKQNVVLDGGFAKLRFEKRTGFQNDDPKRNSTPYASGYLDTYGLWTQRYGYFEARVKVPRAPGLWPAFWMMPDRGEKAGEQWKRQDTANGGMEFDILEHLSRWGEHRFNIAMHYDGYAKDHRALGSERVYAEPDKDGFVTCGLLWSPGLLVYYYNGREVLRWKNPRVSNVPAILMFTMPIGGWDNNDLDDTTLPADFVVDYVRVWQLKGKN